MAFYSSICSFPFFRYSYSLRIRCFTYKHKIRLRKAAPWDIDAARNDRRSLFIGQYNKPNVIGCVVFRLQKYANAARFPTEYRTGIMLNQRLYETPAYRIYRQLSQWNWVFRVDATIPQPFITARINVRRTRKKIQYGQNREAASTKRCYYVYVYYPFSLWSFLLFSLFFFFPLFISSLRFSLSTHHAKNVMKATSSYQKMFS